MAGRPRLWPAPSPRPERSPRRSYLAPGSTPPGKACSKRKKARINIRASSRSLSLPSGLLRKRSAGLGDDRLERLALVHRDIGQDLAVEIDSGEFEAVHELAVGQALGPDGGVDALDPQGAEAALLHLAVAIGILPGLLDGLAGDADRVLAAAVIALRLIQQSLVAGLGGRPALDACHLYIPLFQAVRRPELHPRRIGVGEHIGAAVLADIFGIVAHQPVPLAGDAMLDLAGGGEPEAFLDAALRLQFGHFRLLATTWADA